MKKIALIVPWVSKFGQNLRLKNFLDRSNIRSNFGGMGTPNLSLLSIAGVIPEHYNVSYIDENNNMDIPFSEYFDIVALTAITNQANRAYEIANHFKKNGSYVVLGGIHATVMPEEALKIVDSVFIGEGENILYEFLNDYEKGSPKQIYRSNGYIDFSASPVPRYDLIDPSYFSFYCVQTTRGCPRGCNYCTLPIMYGSTYRQKSIEQVINEIKVIQKINANAFIFFSDDNMFIKKDYSKELLNEVSKLGIIWGTQTDMSVADDENLLELIHNSGCHWLFIGFESVSKSGLDFLVNKQWKSKRLKDYESAIDKIHKNGINIWSSFMFGGDNDSIDIFENTLNFALKHGLYSCNFTALTPFPGTQLFKQMSDNGRIFDYNWSRYTLFDVVYKPLNMTPDELTEGIAWIYENFYSVVNVVDRSARSLRK